MSRKGSCRDNAPIESFYSHFKSELIYLLKEEIPIGVLKGEIHKYMEFYNKERKNTIKAKRLEPYRIQETSLLALILLSICLMNF